MFRREVEGDWPRDKPKGPSGRSGGASGLPTDPISPFSRGHGDAAHV